MLYGEKVLLRAFKPEDFQRQWEFSNDVEFEVIGGGDPWEPVPLARVQAQFEERMRQGEAHFAIEADGKYIGSCGLFHFDQTAHTCELGIGIGDRAYWGRGYGRDAVRVLLDYAFRLRNFHKVWLEVHSVNERAIRAYRACGFVEEGRLRQHAWGNGQYVDLVFMGILRSEWEQAILQRS
jgi:RimJ/RimL family protein N-acetyltransferase